MSFLTLINQPKIFVEQCQSYLTQLGYDKPYNFSRFISEELTELITNHKEGKHQNNRALLVDDIVDSMWVILALAPKISLPTIAKFDNETNEELISAIEKLLDDLMHVVTTHKDAIFVLCDLFYVLTVIAVINNIDFEKAFAALCDENMSKLAFSDYWLHTGNDDKTQLTIGSNVITLADIFRSGKLNKKDQEGNYYPWYRPADFSVF